MPRLSVVLLLCALAGILGGGALLGLPALGACLIFDSLCVGAYGLVTHDFRPAKADELTPGVMTIEGIFDRAARAS